MSSWKTYKLGEVARRITSGGTPSTKKGEYYGGNIPWLRTQEVNFNRIYNTEIKITQDAVKNSSAKMIDENSIIVAMYGATAGRIAVNKIPLTTNQACCNITIDENKADYNYVYYFLQSKFAEILNMATGAAQQNLNAGMLRNFEIQAPDLTTQTQIAQILSSLDDKIELLQQMNQNLENIAQAIFKEWFVDFNFPGFDGEFVDGLPKGWKMRKLGDVCKKLSKGTTPTKKDLGTLDVSVPFLKVKDISDNGVISKENLELIPIEVHQNQLKRSILETNDILFSIAGTIGRVAIVDETLNNSNCNQAIAFIRLLDKNNLLEYVYLCLKDESIQNTINSSIVQGVQANVSLSVLNNTEIIVPSDDTITKWNNLIKPIYSKILTNNNQIQTLTQTRDTLLPKLMRGELEVKN